VKILFINTGPWGTGSFTVIKGIAKEFLKLGHEIKILFPDANLETVDKDEYYKNTELYHIWEFPIKNQFTNIPTFPLMITDPHPRNINPITFKDLSDEQLALYEDALTDEISKLVESFKPDIIECHHIWYASWVCHKMHLAYSVVAHHSDQLGFRYYPKIQPQAIEGATGAKAIFAISPLVKGEIMRLYHIDESKIFLTENGYDKDIFKQTKIDKQKLFRDLNLTIPHNARIVSFAGKLSRTKGIDVLLRANKLLDTTMNIHIIVMGAGNLEQITNRMEPNSFSLANIHFIGHQTPEIVSNVHNISDVGVMPSRSEGFGISCLEAMACGLPMAVSRSGAPENFAVGKIIEKGSPEELAAAIMEILNLTENEYQTLSQEAVQKAEKFSWDTIAKKHLAVYKNIIRIKQDCL